MWLSNSSRYFRPRLQELEDRSLFSVNFPGLADFLAAADNVSGRLDTLHNNLVTQVNSIKVDLPVLNDGLDGVQEAKSFLNAVRAKLHDALAGLGTTTDPAAVRQAIFDALGPSGIDVLGNQDQDPAITPADVGVAFSNGNNNVDITVHLHKAVPVTTSAFNFGVGLPGLGLDAQGAVHVDLTFDYEPLTIKVTNSNNFAVDTSAANEINVGVSATIPGGQLTGQLGFLMFSATDAGTHFDGTFVMDVTTAGSALNVSAPQLTGTAEVLLDLDATFGDNPDPQYAISTPGIGAQLHVLWTFANEDHLGSTNHDFGNNPVIELNNIELTLGTFVTDLVKPAIDLVQFVTAPFAPIFHLLDEPLPILSEAVELLGDDDGMSLLDVAEIILDTGLVPPEWELLATVAIELINLTNLIDGIKPSDPNDTSLQNAVLHFGNYTVSGDGNVDVRDLLAPGKGLTDPNWSNLVGSLAGNINLDPIKDQINNLNLPDGMGDKINDVLDKYQQAAGNGLDLAFPLFDNIGGGVVQLLLGHDVDLVSFTMQFFAQGSVPLPSFSLGGIDIDLTGAFTIDTDFKIAYDTFGLREVLKGADVTALKDGFYLGSDSKIFLDGELSAVAAVGTDFYEAGIFGGLKGNILTTLDQSNNNPGVDGDIGKLRFFAGEIGDCFIDVEGEIGGYLDLGVRIGVDVPLVGFVGVELTFNLAETTLPFNTGCTNPFAEPPQIQLADFLDPNNSPGVLTLNMGSQARRDARKYKSDVENETFAVTIDPDDPSKIAVYFGGQKQSFAGVTRIVAFGDSMDDKITIADDVLLDVELHGGADNDQLLCHGGADVLLFGDGGDDVLQVDFGNGTLLGGAGNDQMAGGCGTNLLGELNGEPGDDILHGGSGHNTLYGGLGDDILYAGPLDDLLDGGIDDDLLIAGAGGATMNGNRGNDKFTWKFGNGSPNIDGGGGVDALGLTGSDAADSFLLRPINGARLQVEVSDSLKNLVALVRSSSVEHVDVEGQGGADDILVKALTGTAVEVVSVDTADKLTPDGAKDTIVVNATAQAEGLTVETVDAQIKLPPPHEQGEHGGIMKVSGLPRVANQLQPTYVVFAMNYADDLTLNAFPGDDAIVVKSITGPTTIRGNMANGPALGSDNDVITVFAKKPTVGAVPGDYLDLLTIDGDRGQNTLIVDETQSTIADQVLLTSTHVSGKLLPGVTYMATGGNWKPGVFLKTGAFADIVNVTSTLDGPVTSVETFGGDDIVNVSSNAPAKYGTLMGIAGNLSVDTGPGAQNKLNLVDTTATAGNQAVVVTTNKVLGFAGPLDDTLIKFASTFGQLQVLLDGSNTLSEKFLIDSPTARIVVHGNSGNEKFNVLGSAQSVTLDGGIGNDQFTLGFGTQKLDALTGALGVVAGPGQDLLLVQDSLAAAGKTYQLSATTLSRTGTGVITFDPSLETLNLGTSNLTNTTQVSGIPPVTNVHLNSGGGTDTLIGPNASNNWQVLATNAGTLNNRITFIATEKLIGGFQNDRFTLANGIGLAGTIDGQLGQDILDYGAYTTSVKFNLGTHQAPNIAGFAAIEMLVGGLTALDSIIGPNQPTNWHITGDNRGTAGPVGFADVEGLIGGTAADIFNFHEVPGPSPTLAKLSGNIQGQAGIDRLDYASVLGTVIVDLASGQASGVAGQVGGIENVTGGQADDVLMGDALPNVLSGGPGADILLGRDGADELHGDAGRDLLVGGLGADTQFGGADDDLLIAGFTAHDGQVTSLRLILAEWNQPAESYDRRMSLLRAGGGLNGSLVLTSSTVSDDLTADELWGGGGDDWFWVTLPADTIPDLSQPPERVN